MTDQDNFILGELSGQMKIVIANQDKLFTNLSESKTDLLNKFNALPCIQQGEDIKTLQVWKNNCTSEDKLKKEGNISLRNAVIMCIVTALITLGVTITTNIVMYGQHAVK